MYNGREDMPSLSSPHHLEKTLSISGIIYYTLLLLLSLAVNEDQLNFRIILGCQRKTNGTMERIVFSYFISDDPLITGM
jgi:hypothetical protein